MHASDGGSRSLAALGLLTRLAMLLAAAACVPVAQPTVTIGLVAPFEGRYREVGYEVIYAVRLAVREANAAGGVAGYNVAVMALDDGGEAESAVEQAHKLSVAPEVVATIGHWLERTTVAGADVYAANGLPVLATTASPGLAEGAYRLWLTQATERAAAPDGGQQCPPPCDSLENLGWLLDVRRQHPESIIYGPALWGQPQFEMLGGMAAEGVAFVAAAPYPADSADSGFADRYRAISNGVEPRSNAVLAYDATRLLFAAIEASVAASGHPTREGVAAALAEVNFEGLSGLIAFDADRDWTLGRGWMYWWREGQISRR